MLPGYRVQITWDEKGEQVEEVVVQAASREEAETRVRHVRGAVDQHATIVGELTGGEFAEYDLEPGAVKDGYAEDA